MKGLGVPGQGSGLERRSTEEDGPLRRPHPWKLQPGVGVGTWGETRRPSGRGCPNRVHLVAFLCVLGIRAVTTGDVRMHPL